MRQKFWVQVVGCAPQLFYADDVHWDQAMGRLSLVSDTVVVAIFRADQLVGYFHEVAKWPSNEKFLASAA